MNFIRQAHNINEGGQTHYVVVTIQKGVPAYFHFPSCFFLQDARYATIFHSLDEATQSVEWVRRNGPEECFVASVSADIKGLINLSIPATLENVTLIQVDTTSDRERAERAMRKCQDKIGFGAAVLLTEKEIPHVRSYEDYNKFVVTELHKYFTTSHCLLIQHDGYVINPNAWRDEFLEFDYIGAPWWDNVQGNGGFSLRSKKFCEATATIEAATYAPEDVLVCRTGRQYLEGLGIKYAPVYLADTFSFEKSHGREYYGGQFGFHGSHSTSVIPNHWL